MTLASETGTEGAGVLQVGVLEIQPEEGLVVVGGEVVLLSRHEFALLAVFAGSPGRVTTRQELYARAWGRPLRPGDRTVDVYVRRLRVKLEEALPGWSFIHTHVGFGYRLAPERSRGFHTDATRS